MAVRVAILTRIPHCMNSVEPYQNRFLAFVASHNLFITSVILAPIWHSLGFNSYTQVLTMCHPLEDDECNVAVLLFNMIARAHKFTFAFAGMVAAKILKKPRCKITHFEIVVPNDPAWQSNLKLFAENSSLLYMENYSELLLRIRDGKESERNITVQVFPAGSDEYPEWRVTYKDYDLPVIPPILLLYQRLQHFAKFRDDQIYKRMQGPLIDHLHWCVKSAADTGDLFPRSLICKVRLIAIFWTAFAGAYFTPLTQQRRENWEKLGIDLPPDKFILTVQSEGQSRDAIIYVLQLLEYAKEGRLPSLQNSYS
jgi:hypothetical protein